jgi:hypothetical protein
VDFSKLPMGLRPDSQQVREENLTARDYQRQILFLVARRMMEGALNALKYPGKLHKLVHQDPDKRAEAKAEVRRSILRHEAAAARTDEPLVVKMVQRSFWSEPMGELVSLIVTRGDEAAWEVLLAYLTEWSECWGTSDICELGILKVKEAATRTRSTKKQKKVFQWSTLKNSGLVNQFGRNEVEIRTSMPAPRVPPADLFEVTGDVHQGETLDFRSITKKKPDWCTLAVHNDIVLAAEEHALDWMWEHGNYNAGSFWWTNLLPQLQIVEHDQTKVRYVVVRVVENVAALAFRAPAPVGGHVTWPRELSEFPAEGIQWLTVHSRDSMKGWSVVVTTDVSPLGMHVEYELARQLNGPGTPKVQPRITLKVEGPVVNVLQWQADRGFPGIPGCQSTLSSLHAALGVPDTLGTVVEDALGSAVEEEAQALAIMVHLKKQRPMNEVIRVLRQRRSAGEQVQQLRGLLDADVLHELLHQSDQQATKDFIIGQEKRDLVRVQAKRGVPEMVKDTYAKVPGLKTMATAGQGGGGGGDRWTANVPPGNAMERRIRSLAPAPAQITMTPSQGLLTVFYEGRRIRSFSWTLRGKDNCLRCALTTAWDTHYYETSEHCPAGIRRRIAEVKADL